MRRLKIRLSAGLLTMACLVWTHSQAQAAPVSFADGETIAFKITKFGIKVGDATLVHNGLVETDGGPSRLITFTAKGFKFYDEEKIYLDPSTYYPVKIERDLNIFGNEEKITEYYDHSEGKVRIEKKADGEMTEQVIEQGGRFDNIYGFIYRQRAHGTFSESEELDLHLPTADVNLHFVKALRFKAAGEVFQAYYMRSKPKKFEVFFDSGPEHIPLRIDGALGAGDMSMVYTGRQMNE